MIKYYVKYNFICLRWELPNLTNLEALREALYLEHLSTVFVVVGIEHLTLLLYWFMGNKLWLISLPCWVPLLRTYCALGNKIVFIHLYLLLSDDQFINITERLCLYKLNIRCLDFMLVLTVCYFSHLAGRPLESTELFIWHGQIASPLTSSFSSSVKQGSWNKLSLKCLSISKFNLRGWFSKVEDTHW
jgi:hypothetical protein